MRTTFSKFVEHHGRVEIPMIQRDYAQGRPDQHIVRDEFLADLRQALILPTGDPKLPLDLDFVYGSVIGNAFRPLDGQQRLTTLFLLHWYLAWVDGRLDDFRSRFVSAAESRFAYEVRPSSRDFINGLSLYEPTPASTDCVDLGALIADQPWYFRSWQFDPTIRSAISMLDRMHLIFRNETGLFSRLIDDELPAVTFQVLDLKKFDLSDDLYIKMNARGKPLTPFETFKARFERHLQSSFPNERLEFCGGRPIADFFAHEIDTRWSNFFWPFRDPRTATFDDAIMNFMRVVIAVTRAPAADSTTADLTELRSAEPSTYTWFHDRGWLDWDMIAALTTLLVRWSVGPEPFRRHLPANQNFDELSVFKDIIAHPTKLKLDQLVQIAGYVQYLVAVCGPVDPVRFAAWMRVVTNLATNTDYNRPDDLRRSLAGIRDLAAGMDDITAYLVQPGIEVQGFLRLQVAEERIKAHLIRLGAGWPERIGRVEGHPYFRGQIGFLLRFAGVDLDAPEAEIARLDASTAADLVEPFEHYLDCASQMFDDLQTDPAGAGRVWERALLTVGDFLLPVGRNHSLLVITQDEPWSWRRLLRNAAEGRDEGRVLRDLWDKLDSSADRSATLATIVATDVGVDLWRKVIRDTPEIYSFGSARMLRFEEDRIYPLRRLQMNGARAELHTFALHQTLKRITHPALRKSEYSETVGWSEEPHSKIEVAHGSEAVTFGLMLYEAPDLYGLYLETPQAPGPDLKAILLGEGFSEIDEWWTKHTSPTEMKADVLSLLEAFH